jgi:uncharacterized protein YdhG (YjbR/CyaY superfamily)
MPAPTTVDAYIASFPPEVQTRLEDIRAAIAAAAPEATETISYGIPTFKLSGTYLLYFAGWKRHLSVYPIPLGDHALTEAVAPWRAAKGTLRFPLSEPTPLHLIPLLVAERRAELAAK